jgi:hypothetical protein
MGRKSHRCWFVILTIALLHTAPISLATALPHLKIPELVAQSEVVVVADVSRPEQLGRTGILFNGQLLPGERYKVEVHRLYTLSGSCPDNFAVMFELPDSGVGYIAPRQGTRMLFLKRAGEGETFVPTNPYYPDLPAVRTPPNELQGQETALQVITELGAVIASPDASSEDKVIILGHSYAIPDDNNGFTKHLLSGVQNTTDTDVRSRIRGILLSRNEISELPNVCDALLQGNLPAHEKELLLGGIRHKLTNQDAAPQLARLLQSPDPEVKEIGAQALWHTASASSVPVLAKLLDDENRDVRCFAMRGLADATGQAQWGPGPAACEGNEAKYRQHWHDWATQNSLPQPVPTTNLR